MGDPRRLKKKYSRPMHPWQRETIDAERIIKTEYALKNKQELWRMNSLLRGFKNQAKRLIAGTSKQSATERDQLVKRIQRMGLLSSDAKLDDILSLTVKNVLDRRLQSIVHRKGLARSMKQSRQFITHNHIFVSTKKINAPSYLVLKTEEENITFSPRSALSSAEHPERSMKVKPVSAKAETKVKNEVPKQAPAPAERSAPEVKDGK